MSIRCRKWLALLGFSIMLGGASSCARGPQTSLAGLNPFLWRQWAEDRQYGRTGYDERQDLRSLAEQAAKTAPVEQERLARELTRRLRSEADPLFRADVVRALGGVASPAAAEGLKLALQDEDVDVRIAACEAWGRRGGSDAVQALAATLNGDTDSEVRMAAARELGEVGDPAAVRALGLALEDPDPALQWRAVQSLEAVTGRDFGDSVPACREFVQSPPPISTERQQPSLAKRLRELF